MSVKLEKPEKNTVVLEIEVDNEFFVEALEKAYNKNKRKFDIPGFRKGKAPMKAIERMYGESIFYEDAVDMILPEKYEEAVEETKIQPVTRPEIDIKEIGRDKNFVFTAKVTVKPDVIVGDYKNIEVEKVVFQVEDKDVDKEIDSIVKRNSRKVTVEDRPVQDQDTCDIDYEGFIDGVPFEGGKAEGHNLIIGSGSFIPGFEEQLIGKNTGDEFEISVKFPEEYHNNDVAGKDAVFKVKINSISVTEYPEVDDEFAKDISEFDTLEEYKADVRKKLQEQAEERSKIMLENSVIEAVLKNTEIDVPEVMIQNQINQYLEEFDRQIQYQYQGLTLDRYMSMIGTSKEDFAIQYRDQALREIKTTLLLEKIVELENIIIEDTKLDEYLEKTAKRYNTTLEDFKNLMKPQDFDYFREQYARPAAADLLVSYAKVTEVVKPYMEEHNHDHDHECDHEGCDHDHDHDHDHECDHEGCDHDHNHAE